MTTDLSTLKQRAESQLNTRLPQQINAENSTFIQKNTLCDAMRYAVLNGGKRLRPLLVYAAGALFDTPLEKLDAAACTVEFMHCYSLVHDDLPAMDDDDLRRGKPTCHIAYDQATAILVGDALQSLAFETLATAEALNAEQRLSMVQQLSLASGAQGMVGGQALDMSATGQTLDVASLNTLHQLKTGALLSTAVTLGCTAAGESAENLTDFGQKIGLAFQIWDDVLDIESSTQTLGKPQQSDQNNSKITYPALIGLENAKKQARELYTSACDDLATFGEKASLLRQIAQIVVERNY